MNNFHVEIYFLENLEQRNVINLKILIVTELILLLFVVWLILNFSIVFFILFCTKEFVKILLYSCIIVLFLEIVLGWNKYVLLDRLILEILYKYVINDKNFYISRVQLKKILCILNNKWLCDCEFYLIEFLPTK